jgi:hypothetical protein
MLEIIKEIQYCPPQLLVTGDVTEGSLGLANRHCSPLSRSLDQLISKMYYCLSCSVTVPSWRHMTSLGLRSRCLTWTICGHYLTTCVHSNWPVGRSVTFHSDRYALVQLIWTSLLVCVRDWPLWPVLLFTGQSLTASRPEEVGQDTDYLPWYASNRYLGSCLEFVRSATLWGRYDQCFHSFAGFRKTPLLSMTFIIAGRIWVSFLGLHFYFHPQLAGYCPPDSAKSWIKLGQQDTFIFVIL